MNDCPQCGKPFRNEMTFIRAVAWLTKAENELKALSKDPKANMGRRKVARKRSAWIAQFRYAFMTSFEEKESR